MVDTASTHKRTAAVTTPTFLPPAVSTRAVEPPQTPIEATVTPPGDSTCLWCGHPFHTHRGGSPKRFSSAQHRNQFWSALRRWGERTVASGWLTLDHVKNGDPAACTPPSGRSSPAPIPEPHEAAEGASAEFPDKAAELLDDLLIALTNLPDKVFFELGRKLPAASSAAASTG